jgi:hypothetical protein
MTAAARCIAAHDSPDACLAHLLTRSDVRISSPFGGYTLFTFPDGSSIQFESRMRELLGAIGVRLH